MVADPIFRREELPAPAPRRVSKLGEGVTAANLCKSPPQIPPELIGGVLYGQGTMMLSGPSKSRKTYTFLDAAVSVATGADWLGFKTARHPVIYLNFELSAHSMHSRLQAICAAKDLPVPENLRLFNLRGQTVTVDDLAHDLPDAIARDGAGLVVCDPWYKIAAVSGADENSNNGQATILAQIEGIVNTSGAALLVGHHFAKGNASGKNSIDRAAGAGAMARWGDAIATLTEHEEEAAMTLEMHLRDFAPVEPIALRWNLPLWSRDHSLNPSKLKRSNGPKEQYLATHLLVKLSNGMTNGEWFAASGWADSTFRRKRDELIKAGKIGIKSGRYYRA